jgi:hypothetical protein
MIVLNYVAWSLFFLGVLHCLTGLVLFKEPLKAAFSEGLIGKFQGHDRRRIAFWFMVFGPLLIMAGHVSIHAVDVHDMALLKMVGFYLLGTSLMGVVAVPKSPFLAALVVSCLLLVGVYGLVS